MTATWTEATVCDVKSGVQVGRDVDRLLEGAHVPELERVVATARRDVTVVVAERDARGVAALGVRVGHLHRRADERFPVVPHLEKRLFKIQTLYLNTRETE